MSGEHEIALSSLTWPAPRLGEGIEYLARKAGLTRQSTEMPPMPATVDRDDTETLGDWIGAVAARLGLESEATESAYADVKQFVQSAGPAILRATDTEEEEPGFLLLLKGGLRQVSLIGPDLGVQRMDVKTVRDALCRDFEAPFLERTDRFLVEAGIPPERREVVRRAILTEQFGSLRLSGFWLLRLSPGAGMGVQARRARLPQPAVVLLGAHIVQMVLSIGAWWMIGKGALEGHFDWGWLLAWALILLTAIPFQLLLSQAQARLAIGTGGIFKQRLLYGVLKLEPEEIRHQGAGQFLGRVMESEAVELLALGGGIVAVLALIELAIAAAILSVGAGGWPHALLLAGWVVVALVIGWRYLRRSTEWVATYREMTNDLVEQMVGHRTRLAQQDPARWHDEEDQSLARYLSLSERLDQISLQGDTVLPRGWLLLGLGGLAYAFVVAGSPPAALAVSLGGILLAQQALTSLMLGMNSIAGAITAWQQVGPLFQAAARPAETAPPNAPTAGELEQMAAAGQTVITARELDFRYRERGRFALRECSLRIRAGDRLLLEGPSGGGKSTLAALLAGLRKPESGLLLLWGLDRQTMGSGAWRKRVVLAPQFHENHVMNESLAFNLLMGRRWPAETEDLAEATAVCGELGLGDLLKRMPGGLFQTVGESGWQLSHGEQSRLFIARAILQKSDLIILDESFGALDPENLHRALGCVLKRAPALVIIAHP